MSSKFSLNKIKQLNKIVFWKYRRKYDKNTTELFQLISSSIFKIGLENVSVVCDGVYFY